MQFAATSTIYSLMAKQSRQSEIFDDPDWAPKTSTALQLLLAVRIFSCVFNFSFITDVDEVMNYWEPTHFLVYGNGFQTWEYRLAR